MRYWDTTPKTNARSTVVQMTLSSIISKTASQILKSNRSSFSEYPALFIDLDHLQISW